MRTFLRALLTATLLAITTVGAGAAPLSSTIASPPVAAAESPPVTLVQYRGRGYYGGGGGYYRGGYGRYYGGWRGPAIGLGVSSAIVAGAIIANQAYRPRRGYYYDTYAYDGPYYYPAGYTGDPRKICADHFRSFEWRSGYYTTYGGERRLCPYLRG